MAEEAALNMDGTQDVEMQRQAQLRRARLQAVRQQGINKAIDTATGGVKKFTPQGFALRQVAKRVASKATAPQDNEDQRSSGLRHSRIQSLRQQGIGAVIDAATSGVKQFTPQGFVLRHVVKRLLSNPLALGFLVPFLIIGGLVFGIMMLFVPFIIIILLVVGTVGGVAGFIGDALTNIGHALGF
ncbi:MAG: hypothetical protein A3A80_02305 [Candidatus Terrybacteria bacterium RIFCSPLOWO2_01_FULL_44_24]|uniref:Uncharacterized protein n=1 Tax=Candidatus Terrybacteria bacterium RIFCSPHIGHO2_01_FULL_43_35 TaxID=1802361 RepID=A0A1G2PEG3_9BACT|nr:MAG: hypothetical protein A2828_02095 [Candidatus Terrybacteria bacterium RIFCSPHIGHO2_01_FULL_43_35]OHA50911.1 MAG: hypothetical protein A3A80_02305 [Candidatus Terrybacteria bacterium RIFCSPLOWO2_01_FULL_44_24]HLF67159.1 hypothetical protein [Gammaproteobacteria bacterium]